MGFGWSDSVIQSDLTDSVPRFEDKLSSFPVSWSDSVIQRDLTDSVPRFKDKLSPFPAFWFDPVIQTDLTDSVSKSISPKIKNTRQNWRAIPITTQLFFSTIITVFIHFL